MFPVLDAEVNDIHECMCICNTEAHARLRTKYPRKNAELTDIANARLSTQRDWNRKSITFTSGGCLYFRFPLTWPPKPNGCAGDGSGEINTSTLSVRECISISHLAV